MMTSTPKSPLFKRPDRAAKWLLFLLLLALQPVAFSEEKPGDNTATSEEEEKEEEEEKSDDKEDEDDEDEKVKTVAEVLKDCDTTDGLFPIHQNRKNGKIFLEISADQIGKEFIHFSHTLDGVTGLGHFRGEFADSRIFTIRRHFERIEFVGVNTGFYFHPESALSRAAAANISEAILASQKLEAKDPGDTRFLVEADAIFLKEFFRQLKAGKKDDEDKEEKFQLGDLSEDRTRFLEAKSFPDNTLFRVQYVFQELHPAEHGDRDVADSRFVTLKVQHTLIALPENDYQPRFDDPRVGYFTTQVTDLTSQSSAPYRDFVHRWHLKKQDPEAEKSAPVEPITWWIENTTPREIRETIREGVLAWNLAFESAGFTDAVVVKEQPDDADWDADDIRYHVLRWTSSPDPPFGGYGPSFVNPRTGQILGADIMLEYIFLTNRIRFNEIVKLGAADRMERPFHPGAKPGHFCQFGACLHADRIAAGAILAATRPRMLGNGPVEMTPLVEQALVDLILHEVGHTLGLNHNFRSSHLYDRARAHDTELTGKTGVTSSVMDYTPVNLSLDPEKQGHFYSTVPGPYDHWAIRYGYAGDDEIQTILAESTKPEHAFGNDADDMRTPGRGIDPRVMINDLTSEPIDHAADQVVLVKQTLPKLAGQYPVAGESYHELRTAFSTLIYTHRRSAETISRFVGGIFLDRSMHGQDGAPGQPFTPVPADWQRKAMTNLDAHVFGPKAFEFPADLISRLQMERRGFNFFELEDNEDPKIHDTVLSIQADTLDHLLHKNTLGRIVDTELYGNDYPLEEFMSDLDRIVMEGDPEGQVNSFREALQFIYIKRLIAISGLTGDTKHPLPARSQAVLLLEKRLEPGRLPASPERHAVHLRRMIENALESR